jgi:hypothetical protein
MRRMILLTGALFLLLAPAAQAHTATATATCGSVTFNWTNFASSGHGNNGQNTPGWKVVFSPSGGGAPFTATGTETFSSSSASFTEAIPAGNGSVVASSSWTSSQTRDGNAHSYSATIPISSCASITVAKQQQIVGSGSGFTASPLSGKVGQTVDYVIAVTNTGGVPVSLSFSDPHCDAGTVVGPIGPLSGGKLAPQATVDYTCQHLLANGDVPQYTNTATEVATSPSGPSETVPSNTVIVNLSAPPVTPTTPPAAPSAPVARPVTSVQAVTTVRSACVAAAAKVSSISHLGNTRSPFVVRMRASGVARVTFLLDGHVLKTLTKRNARGGYLSIRINPGSLSGGLHRVTARVALSNSACAGVSRSFLFARGHPVVTPAFTG